MSGHIVTNLEGRTIVFEDSVGQLHQCKGYAAGKGSRLFWTLCHRDAPANAVHPQARGHAVTCPECLRVASEPARRILAGQAERPRAAVGGLPFKPDLD